jgi:hypothetical protein
MDVSHKYILMTHRINSSLNNLKQNKVALFFQKKSFFFFVERARYP